MGLAATLKGTDPSNGGRVGGIPGILTLWPHRLKAADRLVSHAPLLRNQGGWEKDFGTNLTGPCSWAVWLFGPSCGLSGSSAPNLASTPLAAAHLFVPFPFTICARHPCPEAMRIISVLFRFYRMSNGRMYSRHKPIIGTHKCSRCVTERDTVPLEQRKDT